MSLNFYSDRTAKRIARESAKRSGASRLRKDIVLTDANGRELERRQVFGTHASLASNYDAALPAMLQRAKARGAYVFTNASEGVAV